MCYDSGTADQFLYKLLYPGNNERDVKNEFSHPCFLSYEEDQRYSLRLWKILPSTETAGSALTMEL